VPLDQLQTDPLLCERAVKKDIEAQNALLQFDEACRIAKTQFGSLSLTPGLVCHLHSFAIKGLYRCAGKFRCDEVVILNAQHKPPSCFQIQPLMEELCKYANEASSEGGREIHCAAYVMWRLNWIHPFFGGNGRTARAASYLTLCASIGIEPPGKISIPELLETKARREYFEALNLADVSWSKGRLDVSAMESLIDRLFIEQLQSA
jgi:Fic family protein